ncbi:MAG: 30S ribosomal protein S13 [Candidatus Gottesmanbacteria bacterium]
MVRIAGIDLPEKKRIDYALTRIYGIGWSNVKSILVSAKIDAAKRTDELTEEENSRLQKVIDTVKVEGDLRREVQENIKRLKDIGAYRGIRHSRNLPSRGQRTRSNARTKRGKRVTIGAIKKEMASKIGGAVGAAPAPVETKEKTGGK